MFCEKPVVINFSKIWQKTPAGKYFLGEIETYASGLEWGLPSLGLWWGLGRVACGAAVGRGGCGAGSGVGWRPAGFWGVFWWWCRGARLCVCVCVVGGGAGRWAIILWGLGAFLLGQGTCLMFLNFLIS